VIEPEPDRPGEPIYVGSIRFGLRKLGSHAPFASAKNGLGSIYLSIRRESIEIWAAGPLGPVARFFGVHLDFVPQETAVARAAVGWLNTSLFRREVILLKGIDRASRPPRSVELAITPEDGDLGRLEDALRSSGAWTTA
jgi:hypothetical protein